MLGNGVEGNFLLRHEHISAREGQIPVLQRGRHAGHGADRQLTSPPRGTLIKKENEIFLTYKEIQMGSVAKSCMRKGFLIYEEMCKYLTKYEEAVSLI